MLKLIKYEFIQSWRNFAYMFLAYFVLSILSGMMMSTEVFPDFITGIAFMSFIFLGIGIVFGVIITIAKNFMNSMFNRQGYLTLTLPVSTHQLLLSKVLSSAMWIFISTFVFFLGFIVFTISFDIELLALINLDDIFYAFEQLFIYTDLNLFLLILSGIVELLALPILIFAVVSIAHSSYIRNHRLFASIFIFFAYIIILGNLSVFSIDYNIDFLLNNDVVYLQTVTLLISTIELLGLYFVAWYFIDKKVEVQ